MNSGYTKGTIQPLAVKATTENAAHPRDIIAYSARVAAGRRNRVVRAVPHIKRKKDTDSAQGDKGFR